MINDRKLEFFGIGSNSFHELSTVSFTFDIDESQTLVDCGPETPSNIYDADYKFTDFDTLVLTHRHPDHCLGASYFLFGRHLEVLGKLREDEDYQPDNLEIIAEERVLDFVLHAFEFCHGNSDRAYDIEFTDISTGENKIQLTESTAMEPVGVEHTVPTYGFILHQDDEKPLAYSSDTLPTEDFNTAAAGCGKIIHEAMVPHSQKKFSRQTKHATGKDAGEAIDSISPETAHLVHLRPAHIKNAENIEAEAAAECDVNPAYPTPFEKISF